MRELMIFVGIALVIGLVAGPAAGIWAAVLGVLAMALFVQA